MSEDVESTPRTTHGKWAKGQSANPGGRPKNGVSLAEYVRWKSGGNGDLYINRLHHLAMHSEDERVSIEAMKVLLDRGWKKPVQGHEFKGSLVPLFAIPGGLMPSVSEEE